MTYSGFFNFFKIFYKDAFGGPAVQTALLFGIAVLIGTMFVVPMLDSGSKQLAYQEKYGIDPVLTSSVSEQESKPKRYTIRKSVLDQPE